MVCIPFSTVTMVGLMAKKLGGKSIRCNIDAKDNAVKTHFLAIHPLIGTKHKPAAIHLQQRSPYYWWWAFMRRNEDYLACCANGGKGKLAKLYEDFGDIRSDDFRSWWGGTQQKGSYLFGELPVELRLLKLNNKDEWADGWGSEIMVVAVNMEIGRRKLQQYFAHLLQKEHKGKRGRKSLGSAKSTARYPLYRNFSQHNLRAMLEIYDEWKANEALPKEQRKPQWALGEAVRLVPTAMPKKGDTKYITTNKRNVMAVAVSRYLKSAKAVVANTAKGEFPNSQP